MIVIEQLNKLLDSDYDSICNLMQELTKGIKCPSQEMLYRALSSGTIVVARQDSRIIGMSTFKYYDALSGRKGWIEDLVVNNDFRNKGVAGLIMKEVEAFAKKNNVDSINLTSRPERVAAHRFYEKQGFSKRITDVFVKTLFNE